MPSAGSGRWASALWRAGEAGSQPRPALSCGHGSPGDRRWMKGGVTGRKGSSSLHAAWAPHVTLTPPKKLWPEYQACRQGPPTSLRLASGWGVGSAFPPRGALEARLVLGHACPVAPATSDSCNPVDCSPSGSSVHGILKARILEWVAIFFSRESSPPRD